MKTLLICFTLLISISGNAQNMNDWQIGINVNPFIFKSFRFGMDESIAQAPYRTKQKFPNGFATGISIEKSITEKWSLETCANLSWQKENFTIDYEYSDVYPKIIEYKLNYTQIPLKIKYNKIINNNFLLTFDQGVQVSFLSRYSVFQDDIYATLNVVNGYAYAYYKVENFSYETKTDWIYKRNTFGLIGGIGIKKLFYDKWSYAVQLKYEYDLTNAKNYGVYAYWGNVSKHFRLGLDFGLQYHFSLKNNRQSKCP